MNVMFLRFLLFILIATQLTFSSAQSTLVDLSFEGMSLIDAAGRGTQVTGIGSVEYGCGVVGDAILMDGDDSIVLDSTVNNVFGSSPFSLSFYFKPTRTTGVQNLISKRQACVEERALAINYIGNSHEVQVILAENSTKNTIFSIPLPVNKCWNHIAFVREERETQVYINGEFSASANAVARIDLTNPESLVISGGPCIGVNEDRFEGYIDEFQVFDNILDRNQVRALFVEPDAVTTRDTLIFLGNSVPLDVSNTCANSVSWFPASEIEDPSQRMTNFRPNFENTFKVYATFDDGSGCVASDTVRVVVVDPANLDCDQLFLPNAFTPNADGINDTYGIDNPFAMEELTVFEIFDRLGNRVFTTTDRFGQWDGSFKGTALTPSVFVYRIRYICRGENTTATGSFTLLK